MKKQRREYARVAMKGGSVTEQVDKNHSKANRYKQIMDST